MWRYLVARSSLWHRTGVISRSFSLTRVSLKHDRGYRRSQYNKGPRQLHRRVINDKVLQEQLDIMRMSIADLETGDRFGSLSSDCVDVDEQLGGLVEPDQPVPSPARERKKSTSLESSSKVDDSRLRGSFSDRQVVYDAYQKDVKGPHQPRQPVSKNVYERRISVPVDVPDETDEHSKLRNKFSGEKSLQDIKPGHKDWSEKFGSLSHDVDKFLDNYVVDSKRYSCNLIVLLLTVASCICYNLTMLLLDPFI